DTTVSWLDEQQAREVTYGAFQGHWHDYRTPTQQTWPSSNHITALQSGKKLMLNVKPADPATTLNAWSRTAAGEFDTQINTNLQAMADNCDTPAAGEVPECLVTFWHEPISELNAGTYGTAADYVAMYRHLDQLRDTTAPEVGIFWNMEGYEGNQAAYLTLWPEDATHSGIVDYIAHDPYIDWDDPPTELAPKIISRSQWFRANLFGAAERPVILAEFGASLNGLDTDQHTADTLNDLTANLQGIADSGVVEMNFFNSEPNHNITDPPAASGTAFQALKAATEN
ncbi:MAG TPA: hypothetical protein VJN01_04665, partial [Xanthomonadales bacterium]|nr:hypothetical protein [Xanthomonadales bacterium]